MGKVGRPEKVISSIEKAKQSKSAARIEKWHKESNKTYAALADAVGISESTLRNYAHCRSFISKANAELIAKYTNSPAQYWMGETDCNTLSAFYEECKYLSEIDERGWDEEHARELFSLTSFFSLCGFEYENLEGTAEEFNPQSKGFHKITNLRDPSIAAQLSDDDLHNILGRAHDLIELECFKLK